MVICTYVQESVGNPQLKSVIVVSIVLYFRGLFYVTKKLNNFEKKIKKVFF